MDNKQKIIYLKFPFRLISKDNEKIFNRRGRPFLSSKFKAWENRVAWEAKSQYKDKPLEQNISIEIVAYFKDKRHSDATNLFKGLDDALERIIYKNDRQIKRAMIEIVYDRLIEDSFEVIIRSDEK